MPIISVIVPVYKVESYLRRCVDSILCQSFRDFELILVDDGSPDQCGEICEEYAKQDSRIHVLHRENGGLSAARNTGIDWAFANSDSQWLAFIDSDDWVAPDYLEQLYRAASETGCKISACGFYRSGGEDIPAGEVLPVQVLNAEDFYCQEDRVNTVAVCKLYRKSLFSEFRYPVGKLHEDEFTTYKIVYSQKTVALVSADLYAYYQNPQGIMGSKWNPRRMHVLEAWEHQIDFAQANHHPQLEKKAIRHYVYGCYEQLKAVRERPEYRSHMPVLRRKLRKALGLGRQSGVFLPSWEKLWAYEAAYPCKPLWWLLSKVRR